jgi:hypothetical protein
MIRTRKARTTWDTIRVERCIFEILDELCLKTVTRVTVRVHDVPLRSSAIERITESSDATRPGADGEYKELIGVKTFS